MLSYLLENDKDCIEISNQESVETLAYPFETTTKTIKNS